MKLTNVSKHANDIVITNKQKMNTHQLQNQLHKTTVLRAQQFQYFTLKGATEGN